MALNKFLENSIAAFNSSKNCDKSSPDSFYRSYIERKKNIIASKYQAFTRGATINRKKLGWEVFLLKECTKPENRQDILKFIESVMENVRVMDKDKDEELINDIEIILKTTG